MPHLVVGGINRDVVFIATENNTVYMLDASTAAVITSRNLGTAVSGSTPVSGNCAYNSDSTIGITSTPVIDPVAAIMYVTTYTNESGTATLRLHALNLSDLTDAHSSVVISASVTMTDSSTYNFNAAVNRQRTALLLANGNVYAGFGSFCDLSANITRGWFLGWNATTLAALSNDKLTNAVNPDPVSGPLSPFYLSSVWMSGAGAAADASGNIYFVTGNSDSVNGGATSFSPPNNIQQSAVKFNSTLSTLSDYFTPGDLTTTDATDYDVGSSGILLLPDQPGAITHMAVLGSKEGNMYLVNRDNMSHYTNGSNNNLVTESIGGCWCTPSYFVGTDGVPRIVSSGGSSAKTWKLTTGPVALTLDKSMSVYAGGQDAGFFTSVSSNGTVSGTPIIWAVSRPNTGPTVNPALYAFDAMSGTQLYNAAAGAWNTIGANYNLPPVVANGKVYVAGYKNLYIFGLSQ